LHSASQALTSVVFPKPAGAEMRVSLWCSPSFSRSSSRGRRTTLGRGRGIYSFVARTIVDISGGFQAPDPVGKSSSAHRYADFDSIDHQCGRPGTASISPGREGLCGRPTQPISSVFCDVLVPRPTLGVLIASRTTLFRMRVAHVTENRPESPCFSAGDE
jgi:hypothetical protein